MLKVGDDLLLYRRLENGRVVCLSLDEEGHFGPEREISIHEAWLAKPRIDEYLGLVQLTFNDWESFALERRYRWGRIRIRILRLIRAARSKLDRYRKTTAVERYTVLNTVKTLRVGDNHPTAWDVASKLLGQFWTDNVDAFDRLDQVEAMLDALEELGEVKKNGARYLVTGKGIASLSQYEEEERKHRESMKNQNAIRWLTVIMAIAALLQAKVINLPALLNIKAWPW
ncbi:hypothetical protein SAMN05518671_3641 [Stenotrophomonas lactitubi]|nr:hypothetical protein SAMN04487863_0272 [Stenotrophomonas sp. yr243]SNT57949.1 hypothetical protein SAMN05518671_3641 [Stenotrophomonas lactitubi]